MSGDGWRVGLAVVEIFKSSKQQPTKPPTLITFFLLILIQLLQVSLVDLSPCEIVGLS
jgi:hypothetical protein